MDVMLAASEEIFSTGMLPWAQNLWRGMERRGTS